MGFLPDTENLRLRMHRECRERFPRHRLQRKPLVSDPGMHHGTWVTHVPWCMSGSLTRRGGQNVPGIPGACATRNFMYLVRGPWRYIPGCTLVQVMGCYLRTTGHCPNHWWLSSMLLSGIHLRLRDYTKTHFGEFAKCCKTSPSLKWSLKFYPGSANECAPCRHYLERSVCHCKRPHSRK